MKRSTRHPILISIVIMLMLFYPGGGKISAAGEHDLLVVILNPLSEVYEGDTITLPYTVEDLNPNADLTLAPLTPDEATVSASLGTVSVDPQGMGGTITYTAEQAGEESINLTVSNYFGTASGSAELTVKPRPNYTLSFLEVSFATDVAGGGFLAIFSGDGQFANVENAPIQGTGKADMWFSLWVSNNVIACAMDPVVRGATGFEINGISDLASLVPIPGSVDPFTLNLDFQPISLNASNIICGGLGGFTANFPWPASEGDTNNTLLNDLYFPGEGGVVEISGAKTWGFVWVDRIEQ